MEVAPHVTRKSFKCVLAALTFWLSTIPSSASMGGTQFHVFSPPPPASDFPMRTLDGKVFALSHLKGKVVLLNFWRQNCPYCVLEKKGLKTMLRGVGRADLEAICVNLWDNPSWVSKRYGGENGEEVVYAVRSDERSPVVENSVRGRLMGYYIVNDQNEAIYEVKGFPSTYVIDKQGRVVASHMGMVDWTDRSVRGWLLSLLGPQGETESVELEKGIEYVLPEWMERLLTNPVSIARPRFSGSQFGARVVPPH